MAQPQIHADAEEFIKGASIDRPNGEEMLPPWETVEEEYGNRGKAKRVSFPLRITRRDNAMLAWVANEMEVSKNQVIKQLFLRNTLQEVAQELWDKKTSS